MSSTGSSKSLSLSEADAGPIALHERIEIIDVLRGLAICGILIGNVQWFSGYGMMPQALLEQGPMLDRFVHFLVHFFIEGKFYSIFSFLFGFGFALQIARAEERGDTKASVFKRRLFWLLVIGLLHAYLLWAGDILSVYALVGFVLLLFRRKPDASLIKWAIILMIIPILTYTSLWAAFVAFGPADVQAQMDAGQLQFWNSSVAKIRESSYLQIITDYNLQYIIGRYAGLIFEIRLPKILAMFLLGLYAYRKGIFQHLENHRGFTQKIFIYGLGFGLIANLIFSAVAGKEAVFPPKASGIVGVITYGFGVPALAAGYIALVATLWRTDGARKVLSMIVPVGRMAMTNYLMHTVVCVLLFYGYGLGLFGSVGATTATLIAIAIFLIQIPLSTIWLKYFAYGPMEWIWRQLTYGKRLDLVAKPEGAVEAA